MREHQTFFRATVPLKSIGACFLLLALLLAMAASNAPVVHAATITVNSTADTTDDSDGVCTLREALYNAISGGQPWLNCAAGDLGPDIINITATGTITLTNNLPMIQEGVTISGPGESSLIIDGNGEHLILLVDCQTAPCNSTISGLTIQNRFAASVSAITMIRSKTTLSHVTVKNNTLATLSAAILCTGDDSSMTMNDVTIGNNMVSGGEAGGLYADSKCPLFLSNVTFDGNTSSDGAGGLYASGAATLNNVTFTNNTTTTGSGGAIYASGTMTVANSLFANNRATNAVNSYGGAVDVGGGAHATFTNVTFDHNSSNYPGSAIFNGNLATTTVVNSTIADNSGAQAIGGYSGVTLKNTIVSNNTAGNCYLYTPHTVTDGGGNLNWAGGIYNCPVISADPKLDALANNGGPVQTRALMGGSPAINAGNSAICDAPVGATDYGAGGVDARGFPRRQGFCDIGAFEAQPATLSATAGSSPQSTQINTTFALPLKAHVADANTNTLAGVAVTFAAPASGPSAILSATTASSDANGNAWVMALANALAGSYSVTASATGATPATFTLTNTPWPTTTTITSDLPDPSRIGEAVAVVYTVVSPYGTPTGNVTVIAGTTNCVGTVAQGHCTLTFTTPGSKTLTAAYAGDGSFGASTSIGVTHTVSNWGTYLPLMIRP